MIKRTTVMNVAVSLMWMLTECHSANILALFTIPSLSNHLMYRPIISALAENNHSIVLVTTDPAPAEQRGERAWRSNVLEVDVRNVSYSVWRRSMAEYGRTVSTSNDKLLTAAFWVKVSKEMIDEQFSTPAMKRLIRNSKDGQFDVVLGSLLHLSNVGFSKMFGAPFIGIHPTNLPRTVHMRIGNYFHHEYYINPFTPPVGSIATAEGLWDLYDVYRDYDYANVGSKDFQDNVNKHFHRNTKWNFQASDVDLVLLTTNIEWSITRPTSPSTLFIGDTRPYIQKPLEKNLQKYLDSSFAGVVYFSLGSNILSSNLSNERLQVIIEALRKIPYNVLWKWESSTYPEFPPNVMTAPWFQQRDVLAHPNVKVFVTHGGMLSVREALYHEVPVVVIPFFGDQYFNAERVKGLGLGEVLDYKTMTANDLRNSVMSVARNKNFTDNMKIASDRLFDQPSTSIESAVWWIEYTIRHKSGSHLYYLQLPIFEYLMIDIIIVVLTILSIVFVSIYVITKKVINKYVYRHQSNKHNRFNFAPEKNK